MDVEHEINIKNKMKEKQDTAFLYWMFTWKK